MELANRERKVVQRRRFRCDHEGQIAEYFARLGQYQLVELVTTEGSGLTLHSARSYFVLRFRYLTSASFVARTIAGMRSRTGDVS